MRYWQQPTSGRTCPTPRWMQLQQKCVGLTLSDGLSHRQHQTRSGTVGSRHPRQKSRCTPARSQSKLCLLRPITVVSESAAHRTAASISSIRARRIDGSGAVCRTAAIAKNKDVGVRGRIEGTSEQPAEQMSLLNLCCVHKRTLRSASITRCIAGCLVGNKLTAMTVYLGYFPRGGW